MDGSCLMKWPKVIPPIPRPIPAQSSYALKTGNYPAFQVWTIHNLSEAGAQDTLCPPTITWTAADFMLLHCPLAAGAAAGPGLACAVNTCWTWISTLIESGKTYTATYSQRQHVKFQPGQQSIFSMRYLRMIGNLALKTARLAQNTEDRHQVGSLLFVFYCCELTCISR